MPTAVGLFAGQCVAAVISVGMPAGAGQRGYALNRRTLLIIGGAVVALCVLCGAGAVVLGVAGGVAGIGLTQAPADQGEHFLKLVSQSDYAGAYALCTTELQQELGDASGLEKLITSNNSQPTKWSIKNRSVSGNQADLGGEATFTSGRDGTFVLVLVNVNNTWKVHGIQLTPK